MADLTRRQLALCVARRPRRGRARAARSWAAGRASRRPAPAAADAAAIRGRTTATAARASSSTSPARSGSRASTSCRRARASTTRSRARAARPAAPTSAGLNLAAEVEDGRQVLVPRARARRARAAAAPASRAAPAEGQPLNLNTATLEQLDTAQRDRADHGAEDPRCPRGARRLRLDRGARRDPGHRRQAAGDAARGGDAVTSAAGAACRSGTRRRLRRHPRHLVLFAFVAGLLAGPLARCRRRWRPPRVRAAIAGRALARARGGGRGARRRRARRGARGRARARPRCPASMGERIEARAIVLEPLRRRRDGSAVAARGSSAHGRAQRDRLVAGETAVVRAADGAPARRRRGWAARSRLAGSGRAARLRRTRFQRRRGAHAAIEVAGWRATGARARRRRRDARRARGSERHAGSAPGSGRPRRRCCAAWCSVRTRRSPTIVRDDFQRAGLAHLLAVSGQNVLLLSTLVLALRRVRRPAAAGPARGRDPAGRALRPAGRRRAVDPARRSDGRGRAGRRARRPARRRAGTRSASRPR